MDSGGGGDGDNDDADGNNHGEGRGGPIEFHEEAAPPGTADAIEAGELCRMLRECLEEQTAVTGFDFRTCVPISKLVLS